MEPTEAVLYRCPAGGVKPSWACSTPFAASHARPATAGLQPEARRPITKRVRVDGILLGRRLSNSQRFAWACIEEPAEGSA